MKRTLSPLPLAIPHTSSSNVVVMGGGKVMKFFFHRPGAWITTNPPKFSFDLLLNSFI